MKKIVNRYPFHIVLIAIVYFVAARLGLMLAYPETNATPIWLPTGIALSAVLLLGNRIWPGIALGALIANFEQLSGLGLSIPVSLAASFSTSAGNTLEALAGAYLIHRFTGARNPFERSADVLAFIVFGALISTTISATIGTTTFCLSISKWTHFGTIWLTWWLGDAAGAIVLVPVVMTYKRFEDAVWEFRPMVGNLLLAASIIAVSYIVFLRNYPLHFLLLPILIISAFRLGQFGSAIAICIISGLSIYGTVKGIGPFAARTQTGSLLLLQGFIGSIAIATMVLAAIVSEKKKSESKLRESEERFKAIFNAAHEATIIHDIETGAILDVNQRMCEMFGLSREEALRSHVGDIRSGVPPHTQEDVIEWMRKAAAGDPQFFEGLTKDKAGRLFWVEVNIRRAAIGPVDRIIVSVLDMNKRKAFKDELQKASEKREELELIINKSPAVAFLWHAAEGWPVEFVSQNITQLGYIPADFIEGHICYADIIHRDDLERVGAEVAMWSEQGASEFTQEYRVVTKSGDIRWTDDITWIRRDQNGDITHYQGVVIDVTERRLAEQAQRQIEEKYRILAEESPVSIMAFDAEGKVTFVNNWHLKTFAKSKHGPDFFVGKKITELPGVVRAGIAPELERVLKGETVFLENVYFPEFTGGHSGYQSIKGVPVFRGDEFVGGILLREDVTQRRRAEEALKKHRDHLEELVRDRTKDIEDAQKALVNLLEDINLSKQALESANKKLQELDRLKSMFIASMSHELRTPLNSIIGFTGIILQGMTGEINPEQRDQLQRVYGSAKHLLALINDVIDISKVEAGKFEVHVGKFDLNEVIREAVSTLTLEITHKGLDLEISLPQDTQMTSDRKRLLQCVLNYVSNAVKFTEKGGIRLAAHEVDGQVEIRVEDTGIGIKEEDFPKLFESFVRLDSDLKIGTPGTGLGLYLTKKIATEMLHGEVFVESKYGEGSRFGLKVPKEI